jgi:hypothetical protein
MVIHKRRDEAIFQKAEHRYVKNNEEFVSLYDRTIQPTIFTLYHTKI